MVCNFPCLGQVNNQRHKDARARENVCIEVASQAREHNNKNEAKAVIKRGMCVNIANSMTQLNVMQGLALYHEPALSTKVACGMTSAIAGKR